MTDTDKIEVLKEYLQLVTEVYGFHAEKDDLYIKAQQWLAELERTTRGAIGYRAQS